MSQGSYTPGRYGRSEHAPIVIDMVDYGGNGNGDFVQDDDYSYAGSHYSYSSARQQQTSPRHTTTSPRHITASPRHVSSNHSVQSTHSNSPRHTVASTTSIHDFAQNRRSFMMGEYEEPDYHQQEFETKRHNVYRVEEEQAASNMRFDYSNNNNSYTVEAEHNSDSEYRQSPGRQRSSMFYNDVDTRDRATSMERFTSTNDEMHSDARSYNGTPYNEHENRGGYRFADDFNIPQDDYDEAGDDDVHTAPGRVDRHQGHMMTSDPHTGTPTKKVFYFDIDDLNQRLLKTGQDPKHKKSKKKSRSRLHKKSGKKSKRNANYFNNMDMDNATSEILQADEDDTSHRGNDRNAMNAPQRGFARDDSAVDDLLYARDQQFAASNINRREEGSNAHLDRNPDVAAQRTQKLVDIMQRFSHLDTGAKHQAPPAPERREQSPTRVHSPRPQTPREHVPLSDSRPASGTVSPRLGRAGGGTSPKGIPVQENKPAYNIDFDTASQQSSQNQDYEVEGSVSQDVRRLTLSPRSDQVGQIDGINGRGGYNSGPDTKSAAMYDKRNESGEQITRHDSYGEDKNKIRSVFDEVQQHVAELKKNRQKEKKALEVSTERKDNTGGARLSTSPRGDEQQHGRNAIDEAVGSDYEQPANSPSSSNNETTQASLARPSVGADGEQARMKTQGEASGPIKRAASTEQPKARKDPEQRATSYFSDNSFDLDIEDKNSLVYVIDEDEDGQSVVRRVLSGSTLSNPSLTERNTDEGFSQSNAAQGIVEQLRDEAFKHHSQGDDDRQDPDGASVGGRLEPNGIKVMNVEKYDECESYKALGCASTRTMEESRRRSFLSGDLDDEDNFKDDMDYACMDLDEEFEKVVHIDDDVDFNYNLDETLNRVALDNEAEEEDENEQENEMNIREKQMSFHSQGSNDRLSKAAKAASTERASFFLENRSESADQSNLLVGSVSQSRSHHEIDRVQSPEQTRSGDLSSRQPSAVLDINSNVEVGTESIEIDVAKGSYKIGLSKPKDLAEVDGEASEEGMEVGEGQGEGEDEEDNEVSVDYDFNRAISASSKSSKTDSEPEATPPPPRKETKQSNKYRRAISTVSASSNISSDLSESFSSGSSYDSFVSIVESEESDLDFLDEQEGFAESFMSSLVSSTFGWIEKKQDQFTCGFKSGEFDGPSLLRESMTRHKQHGTSTRGDSASKSLKSMRAVTKKYRENHDLSLMSIDEESDEEDERNSKRSMPTKDSRSKAKTRDEKSRKSTKDISNHDDRGRSHSIDNSTRDRNKVTTEGSVRSKNTSTSKILEEIRSGSDDELLSVEKKPSHKGSKQRRTKHHNKEKDDADARKIELADSRYTETDLSFQEEHGDGDRYSTEVFQSQNESTHRGSAKEKKKKRSSKSRHKEAAIADVHATLAASGSVESAQYNFDFLNLSEGVATAESINTANEKKMEKQEGKDSSRLKSSRATGGSGKKLAHKLDEAKAVAKKGRSHSKSLDEDENPHASGDVPNSRSKSKSTRRDKLSKKVTAETTSSSGTPHDDTAATEESPELLVPSESTATNDERTPEVSTKINSASTDKALSNKKSSKRDKSATSTKKSPELKKRSSRSRRKATEVRGHHHHSRTKPDERDEHETEEDHHITSLSDGERDKVTKERRRSEALRRRRKLREKRRAKLEQSLTDDTFG